MTKKLISTILLIAMLFSVGVYAAELPDGINEKNIAKIVIDVSEPDDDDIITAKFTVYNTTYKAILASFKYNAEAVAPVDYETKEPTDDFFRFAKKPTVAKDLETGEDILNWNAEDAFLLDIENNAFYFANRIDIPKDMPIPNSLITANKQILINDEGLLLYEFYFKKILDDDMDLVLAESKIAANGLQLINSSGALPYVASVVVPESLGESSVYYSSPEVKTKVSGDGSVSEEKRLEISEGRTLATIFLQIGNYAAISNKILGWVDKDNKNVVPYIKNDRTMVPLRYISEALGAKVSYDDETKVITIKNMSAELVLTIGEKEYYNDGLKREMEVAAEVIDGRTFVPVRFVSEALGRSVVWLESEKMVIITLKDYPWDETNEIEKGLLSNAQLLMSPMMRDFAY